MQFVWEYPSGVNSIFWQFFQLPMGVIFKNENVTEDMIDILKKFQSYLPYASVNGEKKFVNQLCVGDQLSVERAVNSIHSVSNGYTTEDRLEGFTMQLGDWHTGVKILEVRLDFGHLTECLNKEVVESQFKIMGICQIMQLELTALIYLELK